MVNFTGTPPKVMRLNYPYIGQDDEIVLVINMKGIPERWAGTMCLLLQNAVNFALQPLMFIKVVLEQRCCWTHDEPLSVASASHLSSSSKKLST